MAHVLTNVMSHWPPSFSQFYILKKEKEEKENGVTLMIYNLHKYEVQDDRKLQNNNGEAPKSEQRGWRFDSRL